jgi:2-polyprenyl-3-methyl-5-hydroxy-6-metoxy-1,4-benzoquinol methylase
LAGDVERPADRPARCLDLGCGPGGLALALAEQGFDVVGVDASPQMLEHARAAAAEKQLPVRFLQGDLSGDLPELGFLPELIVCSSVLEYIEHPGDVILRCATVLAPGGLLLVSVPNPVSIPRRQQQALYALRRRPTYFDQQRSPIAWKGLARMGEAAGIAPVTIRHFSAPRLLARWSQLPLIGTLTLVAFRKPAS